MHVFSFVPIALQTQRLNSKKNLLIIASWRASGRYNEILFSTERTRLLVASSAVAGRNELELGARDPPRVEAGPEAGRSNQRAGSTQGTALQRG